ncbi:MAG: ATP-dependent helicase HrpB [Gammaproteobacteria bacterium]|jgi:ATP-dependent helicase HrpB
MKLISIIIPTRTSSSRFLADTRPLNTNRLPVEDCLDELRQRLLARHEVILEAPPGAGKTTLIPLALRNEPWIAGKKILMLEPRRIAARSAAHRMADLLGELPGDTVGYRMRLENRIGPRTRIEVITEGILIRMLQDDPSLEDTALVIFDEFHERSLDNDLALALCLKGRALFRDNDNPLKLLIMSATLDGQGVSELLGNAPLIQSKGRSFPVDVIYGEAKKSNENLIARMTTTIQGALQDNPDSSLLAFLPGQGEIRQLEHALSDWLITRKIKQIHLHPLYGDMSIEAQQAAIAPLTGKQANDQKVVLATNIAETSLTIEGVDLVVDCGLVRESHFNPVTGMSGLRTARISKDSSIQRMGRAGRLKPGLCYRLWSETQQQQLQPQRSPEILSSDLAPLVLQLLNWGVKSADEMTWMDKPPTGHWNQALDLLRALGAIKIESGTPTLTPQGQHMVNLPIHPRLAHSLVRGAEIGQNKTACLLVGLLTERDPFSRNQSDISDRLDILLNIQPCPNQHRGWKHRCLKIAHQFEQQLSRCKIERKLGPPLDTLQLPGYLLASAYPDRIARKRQSGGYQLANGRSAKLDESQSLSKNNWLAIADISSVTGGRGDLIRSAVALDESLFSHHLEDQITSEIIREWDHKSGRFLAETQNKVGALILRSTRLDPIPVETRRLAIIEKIRKEGLTLLTWSEDAEQLLARIRLIGKTRSIANWPDLGEDALLLNLETWLSPYLDKIASQNDLKKLNLVDILKAQLSWDQQQLLNTLTPLRYLVPSGSTIKIDYRQAQPVLAVKLQEMFGCIENPAIVNGKVILQIHLLSPAKRPLQITQDLAGFWASSYHDVKKDMRGRYPKHPWPDDPLNALATSKTKNRSR